MIGKMLRELINVIDMKMPHASPLFLILTLVVPIGLSAEVDSTVYTKLRAVLGQRLKIYNPQEQTYDADVKPLTKGDESHDNYNSINYAFVINNPKNRAQRILLSLEIHEYADAAAAEKRFWQLRETANKPGPVFQNGRGYDVLTITGNSVKGLAGNHTFALSIVGKKGVPDPFAMSNVKPNPDAGWYAGLADFVTDAWKEARGLPSSSLGISVADPGPMKASAFKAEAAQDLSILKQQMEVHDQKSAPARRLPNPAPPAPGSLPNRSRNSHP